MSANTLSQRIVHEKRKYFEEVYSTESCSPEQKRRHFIDLFKRSSEKLCFCPKKIKIERTEFLEGKEIERHDKFIFYPSCSNKCMNRKMAYLSVKRNLDTQFNYIKHNEFQNNISINSPKLSEEKESQYVGASSSKNSDADNETQAALDFPKRLLNLIPGSNEVSELFEYKVQNSTKLPEKEDQYVVGSLSIISDVDEETQEAFDLEGRTHSEIMNLFPLGKEAETKVSDCSSLKRRGCKGKNAGSTVDWTEEKLPFAIFNWKPQSKD